MRPTVTKCIIIFLVLICSKSFLFAQNLQLKGQIVTVNGGLPVAGATIILMSPVQITTSDAHGNFNFKELIPSSYHLAVSYLGFENVKREIYVTDNVFLKIELTSSTISLAEIKVSPGKSISQSESISEVDKLLRPVNTAQDLLQLVPGLFIAQHAGGGKAEQIFLRGFDCDHGTDFNISVDGMPVNMVSHAHGQGYSDFHFVIPETVDRLKVYKGPYNVRFGDFATSGTGEFFTKNYIERNEVKTELGMFDTRRVLGMFKVLDKKHLFSNEKENIYLAGENNFTNSYFDNKQNFNRYNLFGKYSGNLNANNYLTFSVSDFSARWNASGQVPERAIEEGIIDRFGSIDPSEGGKTRRANVNALLTTSLRRDAVIKNQIYYVNYYFNLYSNFTFFLRDLVHGDEINQIDSRNIFGYAGSYQKDLVVAGKTLHNTTGIGTRNDFTHLSLMHTEKRVLLDTLVSGKVYQQNTNAYQDMTLEVNKHFSINSGVRFDYFQFQYSDEKFDSLSGTKSILRASPKLNFYYAVNDKLQFFVKSGIGFHSNDARAVIINHVDNTLPKAPGAEIGSEFKLGKRIFVNTALWTLYLQHELVYIGDEGTVETNNATRRTGIDFSIRYQLNGKLFADMDINYNQGRLVGAPQGENYIPLAPRLTSVGGLSYKQEKGVNAGLRYRCIDSRPANETNSVVARGYFLLDAVLSYKLPSFEFGLSIENLLNTTWNQAQFDTESRLFNEAAPVSELHFTPGTPLFVKGGVVYKF